MYSSYELINSVSGSDSNPLGRFSFKGLCISSGGLNGLYYLGVLDYHYGKKNLNHITHYSGTSIGSFINLLLIIGYTPKEIFIYICKYDILAQFSNYSFSYLLENHALLDIDILKNYVEKIILDKINYIPTLLELYNMFGKVFYSASYNLTNSCESSVYFSHFTHPDMLVSDAVVCSCSVPFLFSKTKLKEDTYVDGAIFDPTPVKVLLEHFDQEDYPLILTISLREKGEKGDTNSFIGYASRVAEAIIYSKKEEACKRTHLIEIESKILPFVFNMDTSTKIELFIEGKKTALSKYKLKEKLD